MRRLLSVLIALVVLSGSPVAAQDGQQGQAPSPGQGQPRTWGVQPASESGPGTRAAFTYDVKPGQALDDAVRITNFSDTPLSLAVYGTDAFNTEAGSFDVLAADKEPTDIGTWVKLDQTTVDLDARESVDIPFSITVPDDASPGDHAGGIVASLSTAAVDEDGNQVKVDNRVGARIYLRVDGPLRPEITVSDLTLSYDGTPNPVGKGTAKVTYTVRNTGNIRLSAKQALAFTGPFGTSLEDQKLKDLPELLPGGAVDILAPAADVFPPGRLTAEVTLTPKAADTTVKVPVLTESTSVWAVPWTLLGLIALVVLYVALRIRRRRRTKAALAAAAAGSAGSPSDAPDGAASEDLAEVSGSSE